MTNTANTQTVDTENCWHCNCGWTGNTPEGGRHHRDETGHDAHVNPNWTSPDPEWSTHPADFDCGD